MGRRRRPGKKRHCLNLTKESLIFQLSEKLKYEAKDAWNIGGTGGKHPAAGNGTGLCPEVWRRF